MFDEINNLTLNEEKEVNVKLAQKLNENMMLLRYWEGKHLDAQKMLLEKKQNYEISNLKLKKYKIFISQIGHLMVDIGNKASEMQMISGNNNDNNDVSHNSTTNNNISSVTTSNTQRDINENVESSENNQGNITNLEAELTTIHSSIPNTPSFVQTYCSTPLTITPKPMKRARKTKKRFAECHIVLEKLPLSLSPHNTNLPKTVRQNLQESSYRRYNDNNEVSHISSTNSNISSVTNINTQRSINDNVESSENNQRNMTNLETELATNHSSSPNTSSFSETYSSSSLENTSKPKKRGRPKKTMLETCSSSSLENTSKPKKRGRPKKTMLECQVILEKLPLILSTHITLPKRACRPDSLKEPSSRRKMRR